VAGPTPLEVRLERERYVPGEVVRGLVVGVEGGERDVEVSLRFHERSTEYEATTITIPAGSQGELAPGSSHRFAIDLPDDAPPSHTSRHGALWWTTDARVGEAGSGRTVSRRIEVVPPPLSPAGSAGQPGHAPYPDRID
jgi:hypothetical protein